MRRLPLSCLILAVASATWAAPEADPAAAFALGAAPPGTAVSAPAPASAVPPPPAPAAPPSRPLSASGFDYSANLHSEVFGAQLFTGAFSRESSARFNPDHLLASGDRLRIRLWGEVELDTVLEIDPQGNVFLPRVGAIRLLGVRSAEIQGVIEKALQPVFEARVSCYANLVAAQPLRVYVSGFVYRPGLYGGTGMDSVMHYLDRSGGIDPERGSFLNVKVLRAEQEIAAVNLYDFLLEGKVPRLQLADGDVILVAPRRNTVKAGGLVESARRFEFAGESLPMADLLRLAKPRAEATHVRVVRNTGATRNVDYYPLDQAADVALANGDELEFTADKKRGTITVRVEGEHLSAQEYVLPYGARVGDLLAKVRLSERSETSSFQLLRTSVKERQKAMLATALKSFESSVLTARSATSDEARLRTDEAQLLLKWVERAKSVEPSGQVVIAHTKQRDSIVLENGDVIRIPAQDSLVLISGEVLFPNAVAYDKDLSIKEYIRTAGGYTQNADTSRVVIAHTDGSFEQDGDARVKPGDQILVLPKVDSKSLQITKDLTQILYQIAVAAKVVLGL